MAEAQGDRIAFSRIKRIEAGDPIPDSDPVLDVDATGRPLPTQEFTQSISYRGRGPSSPSQEVQIAWSTESTLGEQMRRVLDAKALMAFQPSLFLRYFSRKRPRSRRERWTLRMTGWWLEVKDRARYLIHGRQEDEW